MLPSGLHQRCGSWLCILSAQSLFRKCMLELTHGRELVAGCRKGSRGVAGRVGLCRSLARQFGGGWTMFSGSNGIRSPFEL